MKIAIIGTGSVGSALARGLARTRHDIVLGSRKPDDESLQALANETGAELAQQPVAAAQADVVILALPWAAVESAVGELGDLAGKIVIDCTNPLGMIDGALGLLVGHTTSGGEIVQGLLPEALVVKTLNQVGAEVMADTSQMKLPPIMFTAGRDDGAKQTVAGILQDLGFDAYDAGGIDKSRLLEPFGMTWINQSLFRGKGRNWAFAAA